MYILNNNIRYECNEYKVISTDEMQFSLTAEPTNITGQIKLYSDDEEPILLSSIDTSAYTISVINNSDDDREEYILKLVVFISEEISLTNAKTQKINELSEACEQTIINGVQIDDKHYSMALTDQLNLESLKTTIMAGATAVPYHSDGENCSLHSSTDFLRIYNVCAAHKISQTTYFNQLKQYVESLNDVNGINAVTYGQELTGEYLNNYNIIMAYLSNTNNSGDTDETNTETTV